MPDYTRNEVVDIIMIFEECRSNYRATVQLYCVRFPDRRQHHTVTFESHNSESTQ